MSELCELTAREIVRLVRTRKASRRDVLTAHLERIDAVDGAINAIVERSPRAAALAQADAADRDHANRASLPLDGVPVSIAHTVLRMSTETGALVDPELERELDRVCTALEQGGFVVVEGGIPNARRAPELWAELVGAEPLHCALPAWEGLIADGNRQHIEAMFGIFDLGDSLARYAAAYVERRETAQATARLMEEYPLIVAPVAGMRAPPLEFDFWLSEEATRDLFDHMRDVVWVNLLGLPSIALPNGIQIVARRFREAQARAAAAVAAEAPAPVSIANHTGGLDGPG